MDVKLKTKLMGKLNKMGFSDFDKSDEIEFTGRCMSEDNTMLIVAKTEDMKELLKNFKPYTASEPDIKFEGGKSRFDYKRFKQITDFMCDFNENIDVYVGSNIPVKFENSECAFILAPRMDDN